MSYSVVREADGSAGGVLCIVSEITPRVLADRRNAVLIQLADTVSQVQGAEEAKAPAAALIGRTLDLSRVGYREITGDGQEVTVASDWTAPGAATLAGEALPLDSFGHGIIEALRSGETLRLDELSADPRAAPHPEGYASISVRSMIGVPLVRDGRFNAILFLHEPEPRSWSDHDVAPAEAVVARTWDASSGPTPSRPGSG